MIYDMSSSIIIIISSMPNILYAYACMYVYVHVIVRPKTIYYGKENNNNKNKQNTNKPKQYMQRNTRLRKTWLQGPTAVDHTELFKNYEINHQQDEHPHIHAAIEGLKTEILLSHSSSSSPPEIKRQPDIIMMKIMRAIKNLENAVVQDENNIAIFREKRRIQMEKIKKALRESEDYTLKLNIGLQAEQRKTEQLQEKYSTRLHELVEEDKAEERAKDELILKKNAALRAKHDSLKQKVNEIHEMSEHARLEDEGLFIGGTQPPVSPIYTRSYEAPLDAHHARVQNELLEGHIERLDNHYRRTQIPAQ